MYKLLELVIKHRMKDIQKDNNLAQKIYVYYAKSGLCTPKMLEELEILIWYYYYLFKNKDGIITFVILNFIIKNHYIIFKFFKKNFKNGKNYYMIHSVLVFCIFIFKVYLNISYVFRKYTEINYPFIYYLIKGFFIILLNQYG